ncbi:glycerophosphodiester phosphodiesterase [Evansella sp. AB-rgal1]|uniref:glycerophosphodiester phosphodiesterase n=1 Tax=Evansella sp. AB-rgal1 TaxID=3242696 RepID=UPI00359CDF6B
MTILQKTIIFGHRGSAGTYPENTMESFKAAYEAGAEGLEFDIHLTKDLVPVVIHDETINRTTNGEGWIKDLTLEQLKTYDAGNWFDNSFKGATIPTLDELLQWVSTTSLLLNLELKSGLVRYPNVEKIVLEYLTKYDVKERTIISSFNHYSLVEINKLDPEAETAILFMEGIYEPWNYARSIGASGLHCYLPVAAPDLLQGAQKAGMPVRPFTVNEEKHMYALIKGGCSAIITDYPEKAIAIRNELNSK